MISIGLLPLAHGIVLWGLMIIAGVGRDAIMSLLLTMTTETEGVGTTYAGTALGLIISLARLGNFVSPPLGNYLSKFSLAFPFIFWSGLAFIALFTLYFIKERRRKTRELSP